MKKNYLVLVVVLCFFNLLVFSQNKEIKSQLDILFIEGNYLKVIQAANEMLQTDSTNAEVYYKLCTAYQSIYQTEKAKKAILNAIRLSPNTIKYKFTLGKIAFEQGKFKQAETILKKLYESDTNNFTVGLFLTNIYSQLDKYQVALPIYMNLLTIDSTNMTLMNKLGFCYLKLGKTRKAIDVYKKAIQQNKDYINSYKMLSYIYLKLEKNDSAMTYINTAIKIDSTDMDLYKRRADINFDENYHFRCIPDYLKVYNSGDSSVYVLKRLSTNYYEGRMYQKAIVFSLKAFALDSMDAEICSRIGASYFETNDFDNGMKWLNKAIAKNAKFNRYTAWVYQLIAKKHEAMGKYYDAAKYYKFAIDFSQYEFLYVYLGRLYDEKIKDKNLAIYYYQKYIDEINRLGEKWKVDVDATQKRIDWLKKQ